MFDGYQPVESYFGQIRGVGMLPDEKVTRIFSPHDGIIAEPPSGGRLLVATTQRLISYAQGQNHNETALAPVEELKGVVIKGSAEGAPSLLQLVLLVAAGIIVFGVAAYWITGSGRASGPNVPILNMDFGVVVILAAIIGAGWFFAQHYFTREQGLITFQGSNWVLTFPLISDKAEEEAYLLVNIIFAARQSRNGHHSPHALAAIGEEPPVPQIWRP
ncbi:MAG: hypothetical protein ACE5Q6_11110 [Dehalococcoidia bacterium]